MKKTNMKAFLKMTAVFVLTLMSTQAKAQQNEPYLYIPLQGTVTTEVMFNPFSSSSETFKLSGLKTRFFITDRDAIRLNVNYDIDNFTTNNSSSFNNKVDDHSPYRITNEESEIISKNSTLKLALGYERHFSIYGRLDLYAGGEVGYEKTFRSGEENIIGSSEELEDHYYGSGSSYYDGSYESLTTRTYTDKTKYEDMSLDANGNLQYENQGLFFNVFTGIDFYVYKGLYIGTELGVSFSLGKNYNSGKFTQNYSENLKRDDTALQDYNPTTGNWEVTEITRYTRNTNWTYSSDGGKKGETLTSSTTTRNGVTINTDSDRTSIIESSIADSYTKSTKLKVYIEPALRLGWRF